MKAACLSWCSLFSVGVIFAAILQRGVEGLNSAEKKDDGFAATINKKISTSSLEVLYGVMRNTVAEDEVVCQDLMGSTDAPSIATFVIQYKAKGSSKDGEPVCQIDEGVIATDYLPLSNAPFEDYLFTSISKALKGQNLASHGVHICGLQEVQSGMQCPPMSAKAQSKQAIANGKASLKGESLPNPGLFENANYRTFFEVVATVKGVHVDSFADVHYLAKLLEMQTQRRLDAKYGAKWSCKYKVNVKISPFDAPFSSRTLNYETHLVPATLTPDGWDAPGEYYTDAKGEPQWLGPIVSSFVGDFVNFRIMAMGQLMQLTHFHGMLFRNGLIYNDGAVGFSSGTMEMDSSYNIQFVAEPAGTTFYHGHAMNAQASGNRGVHIVKKRPCNDPYAGYYDDEIILALDASLPWFLDGTPGTPAASRRALRHTTGVEDWINFNGTSSECNFCYPANPNAAEVESITLSYGGEPLSDQPWAGPLINGKGRGIPLDYSSELGSATSQSWGEARGSFFSVNVDQGKTYRLRIVNTAIEWGFRFWIEGHDMTIISISGGDVEPIFIPTKEPGKPFNQNGIEVAIAERFDVLITANFNDKSKNGRKVTDPEQKAFVIHVDSMDGCYKGVGYLLYDDQTVTPQLQARGDFILRNRICDEDCYTSPDQSCNVYKQFAPDRNRTAVRSIEPEGVPPPPPPNMQRLNMTIVEGFFINGEVTPFFYPPLYAQHAASGNNVENMQDPDFLKQYLFEVDEVAEWCIINYSEDRHPMHMHADRFWLLASGLGDVDACWADKGYVEGTPAYYGDMISTSFPVSEAEGTVLRMKAADARTAKARIAEHGGENPPGVTPSYIKFRSEHTVVGPSMIHCHIAYHMTQNLLLPILVGVNSTWPAAPSDLPSGPYDSY